MSFTNSIFITITTTLPPNKPNERLCFVYSFEYCNTYIGIVFIPLLIVLVLFVVLLVLLLLLLLDVVVHSKVDIANVIMKW